MPPTGPKNANAVTRAALQDLLSVGRTDSEIASELGVSRRTIIRYRQKFDMQSSQKEIDKNSLRELHGYGATDELIAQELGCTRQNVVAARKRLGLFANRQRGERGKGKIKDDTTYVLACAEALRNQIVNKAIRVAIHNHLNQGGDEHTAWAATLVASPSIPHPEPHAIAGMPDEMTHKMAGRASDYEAHADRAGLAGVPGHEILKLYRLIESGQENLALIRFLATLAVKGAGYINADAILEQVEQMTTRLIEPKEWHAQWIAMKEKATGWAPKEDPLPKDGIPKNWKRPAFKPGCCFSANGGTGKKGKGGGKQDEASSVAFSAVSRI